MNIKNKLTFWMLALTTLLVGCSGGSSKPATASTSGAPANNNQQSSAKNSISDSKSTDSGGSNPTIAGSTPMADIAQGTGLVFKIKDSYLSQFQNRVLPHVISMQHGQLFAGDSFVESEPYCQLTITARSASNSPFYRVDADSFQVNSPAVLNFSLDRTVKISCSHPKSEKLTLDDFREISGGIISLLTGYSDTTVPTEQLGPSEHIPFSRVYINAVIGSGYTDRYGLTWGPKISANPLAENVCADQGGRLPTAEEYVRLASDAWLDRISSTIPRLESDLPISDLDSTFLTSTKLKDDTVTFNLLTGANALYEARFHSPFHCVWPVDSNAYKLPGEFQEDKSKIPHFSGIAVDLAGNAVMMTRPEAELYCEKRQGRLPSLWEWSQYAISRGARADINPVTGSNDEIKSMLDLGYKAIYRNDFINPPITVDFYASAVGYKQPTDQISKSTISLLFFPNRYTLYDSSTDFSFDYISGYFESPSIEREAVRCVQL